MKIKIEEKCQKGYKTHPTQKTKEMYGKTYRNCIKAEESKIKDNLEEKKKKRKKKKVKKKKGKRDACYHKVKSRYDVWPSAYASGALVKCRKVGAKNWGNKSKKKNEAVELKEKKNCGCGQDPCKTYGKINEEEQNLSDSEINQLEDVQDQLKGAVKAHDKQQKIIGKVLDDKELDEELSLKKKIRIRIIRSVEEGI